MFIIPRLARNLIGWKGKRNLNAQAVRPDVVVGCVAYCQEIVGIWDGMKSYFNSSGLNFDYVLYTSYEVQEEALIKGQIDIAWNGPLAHVRLEARTNKTCVSLGMRDVDRDCQSHIIARADSGVKNISQLMGRKLVTGTFDSPQSYILPLLHLKEKGVPLNTLSVTRFDRDVGKHGDTANGEIEVLRALERGEADAGFISELMWSRAVNSGDVNADPKNLLVVLSDGPPPFDHCQFDALSSLSESKRTAFTQALFKMDWNKEAHRRVMQMEGLRRRWEGPRESGYDGMRRALAGQPAVAYPPPLHSSGAHPFKALTLA